MTLRHRIVTAGLVAALACPLALTTLPASALADPASELAEVSARLESLGSELSTAQGQLAELVTQLETTDYSIAEKQAQIDSARQDLSDKQASLGESMKSSYKSGAESLLSFVLGSTSPEDLVNRIYYLDKVSEHEAAAIAEVRSLAEQLQSDMEDLQSTQAEQQANVEELNARVSDYESRVAEATELYNSLDAEIQAQLEAQRNAEIEAAIAAAEAQEQQAQASEPEIPASEGPQGSVDEPVSSPGTTPTPDPEPDPEPPAGNTGGGGTDNGGGTTNNGGGGNTGGSGGGSSIAGGGVATALAQVGKPYVWGATGPNSFDCSGLVCYSFGYARGRTTYAMIDSLKSSGDWVTSMDQLQYGDLVFPHSGHVGIYLGNGKMVHASSPGVGVVVGPVYAFYGGGSYY